MRVLVTGATGFVGSTLCNVLAEAGHTVRAALRCERPLPESVAGRVIVGDIDARTQGEVALRDVDSVVHAAARAHVLRDDPDNARLYTEANAYGTRRLVEAAARATTRRFVYVSSIKVNGEETGAHSYTPDDVPCPRDAYGMSKMLAEKAVLHVAAITPMQAPTVRP